MFLKSPYTVGGVQWWATPLKAFRKVVFGLSDMLRRQYVKERIAMQHFQITHAHFDGSRRQWRGLSFQLPTLGHNAGSGQRKL